MPVLVADQGITGGDPLNTLGVSWFFGMLLLLFYNLFYDHGDHLVRCAGNEEDREDGIVSRRVFRSEQPILYAPHHSLATPSHASRARPLFTLVPPAALSNEVASMRPPAPRRLAESTSATPERRLAELSGNHQFHWQGARSQPSGDFRPAADPRSLGAPSDICGVINPAPEIPQATNPDRPLITIRMPTASAERPLAAISAQGQGFRAETGAPERRAIPDSKGDRTKNDEGKSLARFCGEHIRNRAAAIGCGGPSSAAGRPLMTIRVPEQGPRTHPRLEDRLPHPDSAVLPTTDPEGRPDREEAQKREEDLPGRTDMRDRRRRLRGHSDAAGGSTAKHRGRRGEGEASSTRVAPDPRLSDPAAAPGDSPGAGIGVDTKGVRRSSGALVLP